MSIAKPLCLIILGAATASAADLTDTPSGFWAMMPYQLTAENASWASGTNDAYIDWINKSSHRNHTQGSTSNSITTDYARSGKQSIRCELRGIAGGNDNKNRNEWNFGAYQRGQEFWYGFSYRFANDYAAPVTSPLHIAQLKSGGSSGDVFISTFEGSSHTGPIRMKLNINYGNITRQEFDPKFTFQRGRWYDIMVNAKIGENSPGFYKLYIDGNLVFSYTGMTGLSDRQDYGDIRVGQYGNTHETVRRVTYIDNLRFGFTRSAADPALLGGGSTPPSNQAPTVNAGPDRTITLPSSASLAGTVSDDGLPSNTLSSTWSKVSGPGTVNFANANVATTTATFSAAGTYQLRLTASDGALSASDTVQVVVQAADSGGGSDPAPSGPVTASSYQSGNPPEHTIDGDFGTRWSASGVGEWIQYDLSASVSVEAVSIAFYNGDARRGSFDILTSLNGSSWQPAFSGESSGTSTGLERFAFAARSARYVRIVGQGNSSNTWNSFTEVVIHQQGSGGSTPPAEPGARLAIAAVVASADDGNVAANTIDGDLGTRWSASGDGQWIRYDLGLTCEVDAVAIAVYNGDKRKAIFDVQISDDGTTWTNVWSGRSSGTSTGLETFLVQPGTGRFVRILGHGNTSNLWNSFIEVEIHGAPLPGGAG